MLLCAGFVSLGNWQWRRALYKDALAADLAAAASAQPVPLSEALADQERARFRKVSTRGVLHSPSVYLDNQIRDGRVGVLVANRLSSADAAADLLVVRGWRPMVDGMRELPVPEQPAAEIRLSGFLDAPPAAGISLGAAPGSTEAVDPLLVTRVDLAWLSQRWQRPLLPWVLYLDADSPAGYLRDWQPHYLPPERHRGYAVQWWGLAAATLVIYAVLTWRQRQRARV